MMRPSSSSKNTSNASTSKKTATPVQKDRLNVTTFGGRPNSARRSTFGRTPVSAIPPQVDTELEIDFMYNDYLQALMKNQLTKKKIAQDKLAVNDQLSRQAELLSLDMAELDRDQHQLDLKRLYNLLAGALQETKELLDVVLLCAKEHNFKENLVQVGHVLDSIRNRVMLSNVNVLTNQEEYDEFKSLLEKCGQICQEIINVSGDTDKIDELAETFRITLDLKSKIQELDAKIVEQQNAIGCETLKAVSDQLAAAYE